MSKKIKSYKTHENVRNVKVTPMFLNSLCHNRTCLPQCPKYIVIHEVSTCLGRSSSYYDIDYYANKIKFDGLLGSEIGYHYLVSDKDIYQFIPDEEVAFHTGSLYNYCSIGIERIICEGTYFPDALHNQAKLTATLMVKHNIPIDHVISHKTCRLNFNLPPKECPSRLIAGQYGGFRAFYQEIKKCIEHKNFFYELLVPKQEEDVKRLVYKD